MKRQIKNYRYYYSKTLLYQQRQLKKAIINLFKDIEKIIYKKIKKMIKKYCK